MLFLLFFVALALSACSQHTINQPAVSGAPSGAMDQAAKAFRSPVSEEDQALGHFFKGRLYFLDFEYDRALQEFKLAVEKDPKQSLLHRQLATLSVQMGFLEEAETAARKASGLEASHGPHRLLLAGILSATKRDALAIEEYEKAIQLDPQSLEGHLLLGVLYAKDRRLEAAQQLFRRVVTLEPGSPAGHQYLGRVLLSQGKFEEAEGSLLQASKLVPNSESVLWDLGRAYELQGKNADARKTYEQVLKFNASHEGAKRRIAQSQFAATGQIDALNPPGPEDWADLSETRIRIALGSYEKLDYEKVFVELGLALGRDPANSQARFYLATVNAEIKDQRRAIEEFSKISPDAPSYVDARVQMAFLHQKRGEVDLAIRRVEEGLAIRRDDKDLLAILGALLREKKDSAKAIQVLTRLVETDPNNDQHYFNLGAAYDEAKNKEKSMQFMRRAIELNAKNAAALNYLGYTLAEMGIQLDEAEQLILNALKLQPDDGYYIDSLGWVYFQKGQYDKAVLELERAVELVSEDATILEHLGDAYERVGKLRRALDLYRDSLGKSKEAEQVKRIREKMRRLEGPLAR
jgi:tetratricopeptide (TPR) repeat protein